MSDPVIVCVKRGPGGGRALDLVVAGLLGKTAHLGERREARALAACCFFDKVPDLDHDHGHVSRLPSRIR